METCPLCQSSGNQSYSQDKIRHYMECKSCGLIFVPRCEILNEEAEKARYESHENAEDDPHYQRYLTHIVEGFLPVLKAGDTGLDFGCGRTKSLAKILEEKKFPTESYDLFFHPQESIWENKYHFIVLSEVIEHLRGPLETMHRLRSLLHPGGSLLIKTKLHPEDRLAFDQWFYKRDRTHVQFFNNSSLHKLAEILCLKAPVPMNSDDLFWFKSE